MHCRQYQAHTQHSENQQPENSAQPNSEADLEIQSETNSVTKLQTTKQPISFSNHPNQEPKNPETTIPEIQATTQQSAPINDQRKEMQQEKPKFINTATNSESTPLKILKTITDPEITEQIENANAQTKNSSSGGEIHLSSNAAVSAFVKGKRKAIVMAERTITSTSDLKTSNRSASGSERHLSGRGRVTAVEGGTEVGTFEMGKKEAHGVAAMMRRRVLPIMVKPPPFLAAVFPWDRGRAIRTGKKQDKAAVKDVDQAICGSIDGGRRDGQRARVWVIGAGPPGVACVVEGVAAMGVRGSLWKQKEDLGMTTLILLDQSSAQNKESTESFHLGLTSIMPAQRVKEKSKSDILT